jgi:hypothetical protein
MGARRLDVTPTQAVSSMLAALTGAIAASGLGIAGTFIGAAVMSLAGTVGAAIYKHYLARSHERLRAAAASRTPKASGNRVAAVLRHHLHLDPDETARLPTDDPAVVESADMAAGQPADTGGRPALAGRGRPVTPAGLRPAADPAEAADLHPTPDLSDAADLPSAARFGPAADLGNAARATRLRAAGSRSAAEPRDAAAADEPASVGGLDRTMAGPCQPAGGRPGNRSRRRWLRLAGAMLGVFVVAMGAVTTIEAIAGKPLETLIWHRAGSGTTIGNVVGHPARRHPATVPDNSPAPSQRSSARPSSPAPSQPSSARPSSTSPGVVSPTPTPGNAVAPSPGT